MIANPNWHIEPELLAGYVTGELGRVRTASVETHLVTCASCRAAMAPLIATDRLDANLAAITERVDRPRRHLVERLMERVGVPDHVTRVLAVTPTERGAWLAGMLAAMLVAVAADLFSGSEVTVFAFLVAAPLLPLVGVTAAVTFHQDPLGELVSTVPMPVFKLFMMRSLVVLAPTIVVAAGASMLVPGQGWEPVLWLLPSFGLIAATLALGSWFQLRAVAGTLGGAWVLAATLWVQAAPTADLVGSYAAFRPGGQLVLLALSLLAGFVVVLRRDSFDFVDLGRTS